MRQAVLCAAFSLDGALLATSGADQVRASAACWPRSHRMRRRSALRDAALRPRAVCLFVCSFIRSMLGLPAFVTQTLFFLRVIKPAEGAATISPSFEPIGFVELSSKAHTIAWGGDGGRQLLVTTRGGEILLYASLARAGAICGAL